MVVVKEQHRTEIEARSEDPILSYPQNEGALAAHQDQLLRIQVGAVDEPLLDATPDVGKPIVGIHLGESRATRWIGPLEHIATSIGE
jgi:hypothetical protein